MAILVVQRFVMALIGTTAIVVIGFLGRRVARSGGGGYADRADWIGWVAAGSLQPARIPPMLLEALKTTRR